MTVFVVSVLALTMYALGHVSGHSCQVMDEVAGARTLMRLCWLIAIITTAVTVVFL